MSEKAKLGVWTPWAKVLCFRCHGPEFPNGDFSEEKMERMDQVYQIREEYDVTYCDNCFVGIQLDDSVAVEHNLVRFLRERSINAMMAQTGGMNSACQVNGANKDYYLVTFDLDGNCKFLIAHFDQEDEIIGDSGGWEFDTVDQVIDFLFLRDLEVI